MTQNYRILSQFGGVVLVLALSVAAGCAGATPQQVEPGESVTEEGGGEVASDGTDEAEQVDVDAENPPEGFETMEVSRVVPTGGGAAVLLVDEQQRIAVPIFVGRSIAMTIQLRLERRRYSRPLTHDLMDEMVDQLGAEVLKVHIDDVKSGVFVGTVYLRDRSGDIITLDSRSSDAIATALGSGVPIFVSDSVIEKAGVDTEDFDGEQVPADELPDGPETQPL